MHVKQELTKYTKGRYIRFLRQLISWIHLKAYFKHFANNGLESSKIAEYNVPSQFYGFQKKVTNGWSLIMIKRSLQQKSF